MSTTTLLERHIGSNEKNQQEMLSKIGMSSIDELIEKTIPQGIRLKKELNLPAPLNEFEYLAHIKELASKNKVYKTYIGKGYYNTFLPPVIQRNVLENPGWYTAYTPYQAEISQGRLEALLNFQTMILDLTGMEIANASLLDEGTAAAEAMLMFFHARSRAQIKAGLTKFFVADTLFPQTIDVLKTRALPLGIELVFGNPFDFESDESFFGAIVQYPDNNGTVYSYEDFVKKAHATGTMVAVIADIMSLVLLEAPGKWGADAVVGNTQRFGVPMGYGGPHAAYFATKETFKRQIPGRIIGVSVDADGNKALRMALQTREQHIKRAKATSNICTAQALLAVMAGMYAVYHGSEGLKEIASTIHHKTTALYEGLNELGFSTLNETFFDTLTIETNKGEEIKKIAEANEVNFFYGDNLIQISIDETTSYEDILQILAIFSQVLGKDKIESINKNAWSLSDELLRKDDILTDTVFNKYHTETEMMRYLKRLENKDLSLVHSMISLGSCTMKLNAASELMPITWPEFANLHPFVPLEQAKGFIEIINNLDNYLSEITGFNKMSMQPNSGAQGEYTGLMVIRAYHHDRGDTQRTVCLIPSSAHGTNPASAVMAGMDIVVVKCDDKGNIDVEDLKAKAEKHKDTLAALMVTYPSTHGVYEDSITEITDIIHQNGGLVYMDGANMNAQVGLTNPGNIGADVCHLNLHKTFAIPHGGGGPGVGPIGVNEKLVDYLPSNPFVTTGGDKAITAVSSAPWGSALVLLISYGYIRMLGADGLKKSTEMAILNANYMKAVLESAYPILYTGKNNTVAHEMILDCRSFKKSAGVEVIDIAKRLIDYGFHAPTVSFPVAGTLMIEPTESESKDELDLFCSAMIQIREEIASIENGDTDAKNNVLKNAPHTAQMAVADEWKYPYSRTLAVYPYEYSILNKYWVPVRRVNDAYGDRNLVCSCTPIEEYIQPA